MERRELMQYGAGTAMLGLLPLQAMAQAAPAWPKAAFESRTLAEVVKALGGGTPVESDELLLQAPELSENGAVVRIGLQSRLPGTTLLALLVEKNPNALAALYELPEGTDAHLETNVKMNQSSKVYAVARAGEKWFYAMREVRVTLGGCGG